MTEVTLIYRNGDLIGAYASRKKAIKELVKDIRESYPDLSDEIIISTLKYKGSFEDFWYYDIVEVDPEEDYEEED